MSRQAVRVPAAAARWVVAALREGRSSVTQGDGATLESRLGARLARWVRASARQRVPIAIGGGFVFVAAIATTASWPGIRSATEALFPDDLPARQRDARFVDASPMLHEDGVVVVEGPSAEATREAAVRLAGRLASLQPMLARLARDPSLHGFVDPTREALRRCGAIDATRSISRRC